MAKNCKFIYFLFDNKKIFHFYRGDPRKFHGEAGIGPPRMPHEYPHNQKRILESVIWPRKTNVGSPCSGDSGISNSSFSRNSLGSKRPATTQRSHNIVE